MAFWPWDKPKRRRLYGLQIASEGGFFSFSVTSIGVGTLESTSDTVTCTVTAVSAGNTVVVTAGVSSGLTISSVADGINTYSKLAAANGSSGAEIWYCLNPLAIPDATTVTVTFNGSGSTVRKFVHAYSLNATASTGTSGTATGVSSTPSATTAGSAGAGEAVFGAVMGAARNSDTLIQPAGFSGAAIGGIGSAAEVIDGYHIVTVAGTKTYNPTGFGAVVWADVIGSFKL